MASNVPCDVDSFNTPTIYNGGITFKPTILKPAAGLRDPEMIEILFGNGTLSPIAYSHLVTGQPIEKGDLESIIEDIVQTNGEQLVHYYEFGAITTDSFYSIFSDMFEPNNAQCLLHWFEFGLPSPKNICYTFTEEMERFEDDNDEPLPEALKLACRLAYDRDGESGPLVY